MPGAPAAQESGNVDSRVVTVTGASRGIGRALALEFAAAGSRVVVNHAHSAAAAAAVVDEITAAGGEALAVAADVSQPAGVDTLLERTIATFGPPDVLVNNAGINRDAALLELSVADWDDVIAVNLRAPFLCTQAFGREMLARGEGRIVNISAYTGVRGRAGAANYCASKAGLNMLTQCAAIELAPAVQVNAIALGFFDSPLVREIFSAEQLAAAAALAPAARMGRPQEVARLALYLAGPDGGFITGQTLALDGGRLLA